MRRYRSIQGDIGAPGWVSGSAGQARPGQPTRDQLGAGCCGSRAGRQGKTAVCQMQHVVGEGAAKHSPDLA